MNLELIIDTMTYITQTDRELTDFGVNYCIQKGSRFKKQVRMARPKERILNYELRTTNSQTDHRSV